MFNPVPEGAPDAVFPRDPARRVEPGGHVRRRRAGDHRGFQHQGPKTIRLPHGKQQRDSRPGMGSPAVQPVGPRFVKGGRHCGRIFLRPERTGRGGGQPVTGQVNQLDPVSGFKARRLRGKITMIVGHAVNHGEPRRGIPRPVDNG